MSMTLIWLCAGILLCAIEIAIPHFVLCFFGLGALFTAVVAALLPFVNQSWQIIIFSISSIAMLLLLRWFFPKLVRKAKTGDMCSEEDEDTGKSAVVVEDISADAPGRIQFSGSNWAAKTEDGTARKKGEHVKILHRNNLTYIVK